MPKKPSEQGPDPLSPRRPRRNAGFGGHGPGKRDAFGGSPERGKQVNAQGSGGSWGGGGGGTGGGSSSSSSGDGGCMVLIVGVLVALGSAAGAVRWLS